MKTILPLPSARTRQVSLVPTLFRTAIITGALLAGAASTGFAGFSIQGGALIDNNGNAFIMRGINYPHRWFPQNTSSSIPSIAATGANCVRLVLGNGRQWAANSQADVASVIQLCKNNRLIAIPEVHDCTGFGDSSSAAPLSTAVDYWISIRGALVGQENFVIINIANEPFGNNASGSWVSQHITAIQRLRNAGFTHTLMVDAANWGQDWSNTTRNNAAQVFNADPLRNIIFSVHMYEVYTQDSVINSYMQAFDSANLPLLVGEFAASHQPGQDVNEASIMQRAQQYGFGYIGWSWSGNSSPSLSALDIVTNFNAGQRSSWGNRLITGANGISSTSQICSVFGTTNPGLTVSPTSLSFGAAAASSPVSVTSNVNWSVTDNQTWISVSPTSGSNNGSFTVSVTQNTGTASRSGTVTVTGGSTTRTVSVAQSGTGGGGGSGIVPNGTYRVVARHSGKALDVNNHGTADGTNVLQWTYGGGNNQRWTLTHLGSNVYQIIGVESGKALAVASTSTANGTNVDIRTYSGATNHRWTISATSGGYFRVTPVSSSGSALDVNGVSTADGANVHIWSFGGGNNQQWIFQAP